VDLATAATIDGVPFQEPTGSYLYPLAVSALAPGVHCLHNWYQDWGCNQWRQAVNQYKAGEVLHKNNPRYAPAIPMQYTVDWARRRLQEALGRAGKGLVLAAFPSFMPYNKNASILREAGFTLLGGRCYPNANYPLSTHSTQPKGNIYSADGYPHWIHIWAKDLKGLEACGRMNYGQAAPAVVLGAPGVLPPPQPQQPIGALHATFPTCCGLRLRWTAADLKPDPYAPQNNFNKYLAVCQLPAEQKFPKGWKRFALYKDFKWGVNFDSEHVKGVQKCPHEFDLQKIEAWEMAQPLPKLA
jgi:hypothetical protein